MVVEGTEDKEVEAALLGGSTPAKKVKAARFQVAQVDKEDKGEEDEGAEEKGEKEGQILGQL